MREYAIHIVEDYEKEMDKMKQDLKQKYTTELKLQIEIAIKDNQQLLEKYEQRLKENKEQIQRQLDEIKSLKLKSQEEKLFQEQRYKELSDKNINLIKNNEKYISQFNQLKSQHEDAKSNSTEKQQQNKIDRLLKQISNQEITIKEIKLDCEKQIKDIQFEFDKQLLQEKEEKQRQIKEFQEEQDNFVKIMQEAMKKLTEKYQQVLQQKDQQYNQMFKEFQKRKLKKEDRDHIDNLEKTIKLLAEKVQKYYIESQQQKKYIEQNQIGQNSNQQNLQAMNFNYQTQTQNQSQTPNSHQVNQKIRKNMNFSQKNQQHQPSLIQQNPGILNKMQLQNFQQQNLNNFNEEKQKNGIQQQFQNARNFINSENNNILQQQARVHNTHPRKQLKINNEQKPKDNRKQVDIGQTSNQAPLYINEQINVYNQSQKNDNPLKQYVIKSIPQNQNKQEQNFISQNQESNQIREQEPKNKFRLNSLSNTVKVNRSQTDHQQNDQQCNHSSIKNLKYNQKLESDKNKSNPKVSNFSVQIRSDQNSINVHENQINPIGLDFQNSKLQKIMTKKSPISRKQMINQQIQQMRERAQTSYQGQNQLANNQRHVFNSNQGNLLEVSPMEFKKKNKIIESHNGLQNSYVKETNQEQSKLSLSPSLNRSIQHSNSKKQQKRKTQGNSDEQIQFNLQNVNNIKIDVPILRINGSPINNQNQANIDQRSLKMNDAIQYNQAIFYSKDNSLKQKSSKSGIQYQQNQNLKQESKIESNCLNRKELVSFQKLDQMDKNGFIEKQQIAYNGETQDNQKQNQIKEKSLEKQKNNLKSKNKDNLKIEYLKQGIDQEKIYSIQDNFADNHLYINK
ncbi:hypothetical protein PPERSA_11417 [Pseudocohnilembus persalinus]|uniref:Uncharacterized protein n=1 Tax=Pseudocohnilembus persalinus TaxID=266149 RepID=A0A0V0QQR4_PSEPJ|nr:hypothetical protein PPERSA_11417 [Pseudocohnilembus persalinus]|eukprot:KRX04293.1 hypothetical protein PPERSA_11417 [Pseudocohnilembus persalinus]